MFTRYQYYLTLRYVKREKLLSALHCFRASLEIEICLALIALSYSIRFKMEMQ